MKKLAYLFLLILIASACSKGENDPFLSLKSRDARLKGTWVLKESTWENRQTGGADTYIYSEVFDGTSISIVDAGVTTFSMPYSSEMEIYKEGDFKLTQSFDGDVSVNTGSWWWLNDDKKKTRIAFKDDQFSYEIERLTNKELVLKSEYSETISGITQTYTTIKKYEKKK